MKKTLTAILAILMILTLAACGETEKEPATTTAAAADTTAAAPEETADPTLDSGGYKLDDLDPTLNYNDETVKILFWKDSERKEFEIKEDEISGALVEQAIFDRNMKTEERLHVKFEWEGTAGNNSHRSEFVQYVANQQAGGNLYDIIATYTRTSGMLSTRGYLMDILSVEDSHINFSQPWWPQTMVDTCTIGDSLYFCSGDISTNVLHFMYVIYYNMEMIDDLSLENPVTLVDNHEWTLDKLIEMTKGLYIDNNNDGKRNVDDTFGFTSIYYGLDAFYTGSGLRLIERDPDNLLRVSDDYKSAKCVDLMDKLAKWVTSEDCAVNIAGGPVGEIKNVVPFVEGRALFCQNRVYIADNESSSGLNQVEWKYGVLPTPLYNKDQANYITVEGNPITMWSIMTGVTADDAARDSAVLECLASMGYRLTTPALFETNMKYRYASGAENDGIRMFDIVHNGIDFDLGRIYSDALNYMSEIPTRAASLGANWGSTCNSQYNAIKKLLEKSVIKPLEQLK